jgi:hypothetical protein
MKTEQEIRDRIAWLNTQIEESKDVIMKMGMRSEIIILKWVLNAD